MRAACMRFDRVPTRTTIPDPPPLTASIRGWCDSANPESLSAAITPTVPWSGTGNVRGNLPVIAVTVPSCAHAWRASVAMVPSRSLPHPHSPEPDCRNHDNCIVPFRPICGVLGSHGKSSILTPLLRHMVAAMPDDLPGLRDKALLLVEVAFRRRERVGLRVRDIQIGDAGLLATLRRSKTDQEGASLTKGIPVGTSDATCATCALEA